MPRNTPPSWQEILWAKVWRDLRTGCWLWTGTRNAYGYGVTQYGGKTTQAHRLAYELRVGPIPHGMQIDHTCRTRHCVNPDHLEVVTRKENILRGESPAAQQARRTHCPRNHELAGDNLRVHDGHRECLTCARESARRRWREKTR